MTLQYYSKPLAINPRGISISLKYIFKILIMITAKNIQKDEKYKWDMKKIESG